MELVPREHQLRDTAKGEKCGARAGGRQERENWAKRVSSQAEAQCSVQVAERLPQEPRQLRWQQQQLVAPDES